MRLWLVAGGILAGGVLLIATTAKAGGGCIVIEEWALPMAPQAAIMFRRCEHEDGSSVVLWDVAMLKDVTIGENLSVEVWPEDSLFHGQAATPDEANNDAIAWVNSNLEFIAAGGQRGPLARRVENFLLTLTPGQLGDLREIFRFGGTAVSDAWPYIDQLRTAVTDDVFMGIGEKLGNKLSLLNDDERSAMQTDILRSIGLGAGFTLRGILRDAGIT